MIDWFDLGEQSPSRYNEEYLVSDGESTEFAWFGYYPGIGDEKPEWYLPDQTSINGSDAVTHYAEVNLPEKRESGFVG